MTEKEIIQKIYEVLKLVDCMQYNPSVDFNYLRAKGAYNIIKDQVEHLEAENAELRARLKKAVELPCKVGDKVYGVGFTDCEDSRTTDEKKKRQIFNVCMKMGGNCEKCKYRRPQIEEFVCTHIQLGDCGIEGKSILIVGDRNENYTANNVFTTSEAAEARLAELKGEKKNG